MLALKNVIDAVMHYCTSDTLLGRWDLHDFSTLLYDSTSLRKNSSEHDNLLTEIGT